MDFFIYISLLSILLILINNHLLKLGYLVSETGDNHQKFASKIKIPLTGGNFFNILFYFK